MSIPTNEMAPAAANNGGHNSNDIDGLDIICNRDAWQEARELISLGIPIFPCDQNKKPLVPTGFKAASADSSVVETWAKKFPNILIGVPTGAVSGLLVIDIDPAGQQWLVDHFAEMQCGRIHHTRREGGRHFLYQMPQGMRIRNSASKISYGVDVRAEGGYVIWWPANGHAFSGELADIAIPPQWLVDLLNKPKDRSFIEQTRSIVEGGRNDYLTREAGKMRRSGLDLPDILAMLLTINMKQCNPPLPVPEVEAIAKSISRYPPENLLSDPINRLSKINPLEYEQVRESEAEQLGVRVSVLDAEVKKARQAALSQDKDTMFRTVEVWPEPVNGAVLLDELVALISRFIICDRDTAIATALWCVMTWLIDRVQVAPLAIITAPEKRCGKSQLLSLIGRLSNRPLVASNISPSAVFRVIEAHRPTLLIDEADTFMRDNEELRGVINSGHTRQAAYVVRCVGDEHEPVQFSTWGAKALSGIGNLPETIKDRGILLELRRKLLSESVQRLRHAEAGLFERLVSQLARFAADTGAAIERARPDIPSELNDRAQDNWEPLLAIADAAGGEWSKIARKTALKLSCSEQEAVSLSTELLADIREVFDQKCVDKISTADLLKALIEDDLKPWATYNRGKEMSPRQLAKRLDEYNIKSRTIRISYSTVKGFNRNQFDDAFARYIPPASPSESVTTLQPARISDIDVPQEKSYPSHLRLDPSQVTKPNRDDVTNYSFCDGTENDSVTRKPCENRLCDRVTDAAPVVTVNI